MVRVADVYVAIARYLVIIIQIITAIIIVPITEQLLQARYCSKSSTCINPHDYPKGRYIIGLMFLGEKAEVQR